MDLPADAFDPFFRRPQPLIPRSLGFIEHYLLPVLYPAGLTRGVQLALGAAVIIVNLAVYGLLLARRRRR